MGDQPKLTDKEITGAQVIVHGQSGELATSLPKTHKTYRDMRYDATLGMARTLSGSPIIAGKWGVERFDPATDDMLSFVQANVLSLRDPLMEAAVYGQIDFGWQGFEKVFEIVDGLISVKKLKPLLQDITKILVKPTGAFGGFRQVVESGNLDLPLENSLLITTRVEGTRWYGESLMEHARIPYQQWIDTNTVANRYDKKVAGANFVVYYPDSTSEDSEGTERDNVELAKEIITALEGSGSVVVPTVLVDYIGDLNKQAKDRLGWSIELLSDGSPKQYAFVPRLQYLDVLKVRALNLPQRSILEGQFGTKAEAGVHTNLALTYMNLIHGSITRLVNQHLVDQLLELNWGPQFRGSVKLIASPLADEALGFLRKIYEAVISNPAGFQAEYQSLDTDAMKETLGLPSLADAEVGNDDDDSLLDDVPEESDAELVASMFAKMYNERLHS